MGNCPRLDGEDLLSLGPFQEGSYGGEGLYISCIHLLYNLKLPH